MSALFRVSGFRVQESRVLGLTECSKRIKKGSRLRPAWVSKQHSRSNRPETYHTTQKGALQKRMFHSLLSRFTGIPMSSAHS